MQPCSGRAHDRDCPTSKPKQYKEIKKYIELLSTSTQPEADRPREVVLLCPFGPRPKGDWGWVEANHPDTFGPESGLTAGPQCF